MTTPTPLEVLDEGAVRRWVFRARSALSANRERLDRLNVFPVPDGDTGTNMYLTLHAALESLIGMYLAGGPTRIMEGTQAMARSTLLSARGNSGVILSQLVRGLADVVTDASRRGPEASSAGVRSPGEGVDGIDGAMLARALRASSDRAWQGVSNPVEGTILTVAKAAADSATAALRRDSSLSSVTGAALDGARTALAATPALLPSLAKAGVVDAGGAGYVLILTALHEIVTGRVGESVLDVLPGGRLETENLDVPPAPSPSADSGPGFEVMYLLDNCSDADAERLRGDLLALGDSVLVVGTPELRTVHVHTDDAGHAVEAGLACGRVYGIRVSWLLGAPGAAQAGAHTLPCPVGPIPPAAAPQWPRADDSDGGQPVSPGSSVGRAPAVADGLGVGSTVAEGSDRTDAADPVGVVACASGPGLAEAFEQAGAAVVWSESGARPTPNDILQAVRRTRAREVIILPNDGDTVMAADVSVELAAEDGIRAVVVATQWAVAGLAALAVFQEDTAVPELTERMVQAARQTRPGMVVVASRRARTEVGWCREGDVLGFVGSTAVVIGSDVADVAQRVIALLATPGTELVTLIAGADHESLAESLPRLLASSHPDLEVSALIGGQPAFALLLGAE